MTFSSNLQSTLQLTSLAPAKDASHKPMSDLPAAKPLVQTPQDAAAAISR